MQHPSIQNRRSRPWLWIAIVASVLLAALVAVPVLAATGLALAFLPRGEVKALRRSVEQAGVAGVRTEIEFGVRPFVFGLARLGLALAEVEPEVRAAAQAVRGCEVGVYRLERGMTAGDRAALLSRADAAMERRGWDRVVGVIEARELVAVYASGKPASANDLRICVLVIDGEEMVIASVRADPEPLIELALREAGKHRPALASLRVP